ncbi:hypothetical protein [Micromonospora tarensis]|uniref:Phage-related minor tail protein n=1 Tax=Micromonospora tarensis TaxID=2806100 RepID=A0ABS1Y9Q3_9ACTN|nr:hypothetical protein [Micromonospora tarensis]MBM0274136.1 hypothetical protein [Micromonospora tarensis]
MARDVEADILVRDKTSPGIQSVERNLKRATDQSNKMTASLNKGVAQWGRGIAKLGGAASKWANSGDSAGKRFARGIGNGLGKAAELGGAVGGSVVKAVSAAGPQVALAVSAVLVGAAVSAAPAVGAAVVGGAGLGGLVGGVLIASKDARVKGAFDDLGKEAGADLQAAAGRFVPATLEATKEARSAFKGMLPDLKRIFDVSATWLPGLTRSVGRGAQLALSGITKAITKAGPIITQVGQGVEGILASVGKVFGDLSDNGNSMALALKGVFGLVKLTILGVGGALNLLIEAFEFFVSKIPGGRKLLDSMTASQDGAKSSAFNLAGGFQALAGDANAAAAGMTNAKQQADELANGNISLARAQIASRDATRQAAEAIKENSKAKMSNRQRADENMSALLSMADAFNQETAAGEKSGIGAGKASAAYSTNRAALIKMAEQAGNSRKKAQELADRLLTMPKGVNIPVNVNTATASARLDSFTKKVKKANGTVINYTVRVNTQGDHRIVGQGTQLRRWGGIDYAMARGGAIGAHFATSPTVLYGERETGGEAFIPRRGDLGRSRGIAETVVRDWLGGDVAWDGRGGGGSAAPTVLEAHIEIGGEVVRVVQVQLRERDRALKRRVGAGAGK